MPRRRKGKAKVLAATSPFSDLPKFLQDNEFITKGYRIDYSLKDTLTSLFRLHNETGNIWTHLIGFAFFLVLTYVTVRGKPAPLSHLHEVREWLQARCPDIAWKDLLEVGFVSRRSSRGRVQSLGQEEQAMLASLRDWISHAPGSLQAHLARALLAVQDVRWPTTRWPMHVFTAGACVCLLTSSLCHLFGCCNWHISKTIWRLDYFGIVVLIMASFVPGVYYGFMCNYFIRNLYLGITFVLGVATSCVALMSFFQAKRFRPFRASLFVTLGLWGAVPIIHARLLHGPDMGKPLVHSVAMGLVYMGGAFVYAMRIPERWKPGAFDIAFHSHQLFHVAVIVAAFVHYRGLQVLINWRDASGGCGDVWLPLAAEAQQSALSHSGNSSEAHLIQALRDL